MDVPFLRYASGQTDRHTDTKIAKLRTLQGRNKNGFSNYAFVCDARSRLMKYTTCADRPLKPSYRDNNDDDGDGRRRRTYATELRDVQGRG